MLNRSSPNIEVQNLNLTGYLKSNNNVLYQHLLKSTYQCIKTLPSLSLAACIKSLHRLKYCVRFWSGESDAIIHRQCLSCQQKKYMYKSSTDFNSLLRNVSLSLQKRFWSSISPWPWLVNGLVWGFFSYRTIYFIQEVQITV